MERAPANSVVAEDSITGTPVLHLECRFKAKLLEGAALRRRVARHAFELHPVIEGEDSHLGPIAMPVGRPVYLLQRWIIAQVGAGHAALEEEIQLLT